MSISIQTDRSCNICRTNEDRRWTLAESDNFTVFPGYGQFTAEGGYLLITTKDHSHRSCASLSDEQFDELEEIMRASAEVIQDKYGVNPFYYEHGSTCSAKAGQCVTHMHMNVVPLDVDVSRELVRLSPTNVRLVKSLKSLKQIQPPYLYLRTKDSVEVALEASGLNIPSQFFRSAIGALLGNPEMEFWNWRFRNPELDDERLRRTIDLLKGCFTSSGLNPATLESLQSENSQSA